MVRYAGMKDHTMLRSFLFMLVCGCTTISLAQEANTEGLAIFEQKIRPVLAQHCYSCHSQAAKASKKLQANLFLDSSEGMLTGGESGPSLVKGKSAESLIINA